MSDKTPMDEFEADELGVSDSERVKRNKVMAKATGQDLKRKWEQTDRSLIDQHEKAISPPAVVEPRCYVCTHAYRPFIELMLVKGHSYEAIAKQVPPNEDGHKPDRQSISHHYREHMQIERQRIRAELEEESSLIGQDVALHSAITERGMLKVVVRQAFDDVIKGIISPEVKDMVQIIKLLNDLDVESSQAKAEENEVALRTFVRAIENICTKEMIGEIVVEAERLRKLDDVTFAMEGAIGKPRQEIAETIDGTASEV